MPVYGNTGRTPKAANHSPNLAERLAPFAIDRTARPGIHALERASRPFSKDRAKGVKPGIASHSGENPPSCEAGSHPLEATPAVSGTSSRYLADEPAHDPSRIFDCHFATAHASALVHLCAPTVLSRSGPEINS